MISVYRLIAVAAAANGLVAAGHSSLNAALTLETPSIGFSSTAEGRQFLLYARFLDGSQGSQVVEWKDGVGVPFPSEGWNSYAPGKDPSTHFIRVNSQRIGPDGALWLVDTGSPDYGKPVILPDGPKLVRIDLDRNEVARVYPMGNVTMEDSFIDDIRFHPSAGMAYLTDAGKPGLIVLDLDTGITQRVLGMSVYLCVRVTL